MHQIVLLPSQGRYWDIPSPLMDLQLLGFVAINNHEAGLAVT